MLFNVFIFTDISDTAKQFQRLIILIPIFRIFQKLIDKNSLKYLYMFFILFALSIVEKNANGFGLDARLFSIALSLALMLFSIALIRNRVFESITNKTFIIKNIYKLLTLCIVLLTVSIGADMYGATLLAKYITNGMFVFTIFIYCFLYTYSYFSRIYYYIVKKKNGNGIIYGRKIC